MQGSQGMWGGPLFARARTARLVLGMLSLLIYVSIGLLHDQRNNAETFWLGYDIERASMASAVSDIVYGAPLGAVYQGVFKAFLSPTPIDTLFQQARQKSFDPGGLIPYNPDGLGFGEPAFATVAMRIFGVQTPSLLWFFLSLVAISTIAFLWRFHDSRALLVVAAFSALTVMLASQLGTTAAEISQFAVGGYRYTSLLGALPGMHIFLELTEREERSLDKSIKNIALVLVQLGVFGTAYFVNNATIYLYGPFFAAVVLCVYRLRRNHWQGSGTLAKLLIVCVVLSAIPLAVKNLAPQGYTQNGRTGDLIWARLLAGMGVNPHWPFGNLAAEYKGCWPEDLDQTLVPGVADSNIGCVWSQYAEQHHMSRAEMGAHLYDKNYNAVMRATTLMIARRYPIETYLTFVYYKPLKIVKTLLSLFNFDHPFPAWMALLIAAQVAVLFAFAALVASTRSRAGFGDAAVALVLGGLSTCGLYIVAWSVPWTTGDLFFYSLALIAVGVVACLARLLRPMIVGGRSRWKPPHDSVARRTDTKGPLKEGGRMRANRTTLMFGGAAVFVAVAFVATTSILLWISTTSDQPNGETSQTPSPPAAAQQGENLLAPNQDFSDSNWQRVRVTVEAAAGTAPNGQNTAAEMVESSDDGPHYIVAVTSKATPGAVHTFSAYVKALDRSAIMFEMGDDPPKKYGTAIFTVPTAHGGVRSIRKSGDILTGNVEPVGDGWFRCWAAMPLQLSNVALAIYIASDRLNTAYQGDGHSGILIWGAQFERGDQPGGNAATTTEPMTKTN